MQDLKSNFLYFLVLVVLFSCKKGIENEGFSSKTAFSNEVIDSMYVINNTFLKGDVRRYGVLPNKPINQKYLQNVITLADSGLPISFPQGHYSMNLILTNITDANFIFNNAIIDGAVNIMENENGQCERVRFDGKLTVLDKLFIRHSKDIIFDSVEIKTDTLYNTFNKKNRGVSIYAGSKNIRFNILKISNTGGTTNEFYQLVAAALQIHGWNNNPENVQINNLKIFNAARSAIYITGNNHKINKTTINTFGLGSNKNMYGLEDAKPNDEKLFSGLWISKCNNCEFDNVTIDTNTSKGRYSLKLDEGQYNKPSFIYYLKLIEIKNKLPIADDELTNVLVKKVTRS